MRWFFLFLVVLNAFYFLWHQQQSPGRAKEIAPLSLYRDEQKNIRLLSESPDTAPRRAGVQPSAEVAAGCLYLGPFPDDEKARALEQRLTSLDIRASQQSLDSSASTDYWVYLPPLASRQATMLQLKELQARKIDSYLIAEGELAGGISLGIFQSRDAADSALARLKEAGYDALVHELSRRLQVRWVEIAPESARLVDDNLMHQLASDFRGLQQQTKPCKSVASQN